MRAPAAALALALLPAPAAGAADDGCITARVVEIYDGDTFTISARLVLSTDLAAVVVGNDKSAIAWKVRPRGYDAPELRSRCPTEAQKAAERALARTARDTLRDWFAAASDLVRLCGVTMGTKYGRLVADAFVAGELVAERMIRAELAKPYDGRGARVGFCDLEPPA